MKSDTKILIGNGIKRARKNIGLTQEELASRIGSNVQNISKYERGAVTIPGDTLISIAQELHCTIDSLLAEDGLEKPMAKKKQTEQVKSIYVQLEELASYVCDELCKYPAHYADQDELFNKRCDKCKLVKLL